MQRDICECESNYNATLQRVEELESKTIDNKNHVHTPHCSIYKNAEYINICLNNLEGFMKHVDASVNGQPDIEKKLDSVSIAFVWTCDVSSVSMCSKDN